MQRKFIVREIDQIYDMGPLLGYTRHCRVGLSYKFQIEIFTKPSVTSQLNCIHTHNLYSPYALNIN